MNYVGCGTDLAHVHDGIMAYAQAHGGKLPGKDKWQEDIRQYVKPIQNVSPQFPMPEADGDPCDLNGQTSICYNSDLAGKKLSDITDDSTILLWEVPGVGHDQAKPYAKPDDSKGPTLVLNKHRGWIQQPVHGDAFFIGERGQRTPVVGVTGSNGSSIDFGPSGGKQ
jgi:hypothetical protein